MTQMIQEEELWKAQYLRDAEDQLRSHRNWLVEAEARLRKMRRKERLFTSYYSLSVFGGILLVGLYWPNLLLVGVWSFVVGMNLVGWIRAKPGWMSSIAEMDVDYEQQTIANYERTLYQGHVYVLSGKEWKEQHVPR